MRLHDETRRASDWQILYDGIIRTFQVLGARKDGFGKGDYLLVDDDYGHYRHILEVQNLNLLRPEAIAALQGLLKGYPDWEIAFRVAVVGKENDWPAMGLLIHDDEIIDDLHREFLPEELRNVTYPGSKPAQWPTASFP